MRVDDLLQCSKPLLFSNNDDDYPYSMHGTVFLSRYGVRYFGITAQHNLRGRVHESVTIRLQARGRDFVPLKAVHWPPIAPADQEWDFKDFQIFEIESRMVSPADLRSNHFLDLGYFAHLRLALKTSALLVLRGYPSEKNWIDYATKVIRTQSFSPQARFSGDSELRHCGLITDIEPNSVENFDGMSGSPVFQIEQLPGGLGYLFAGVLIRAGRRSRRGRFIYASVIFKALQIIAGLDFSPTTSPAGTDPGN